MITNYGQEKAVGEVWVDSIDGAKVITVAGEGCKDCAFATFADMNRTLNIALLWITSAALLADLAFIGYLMLL